MQLLGVEMLKHFSLSVWQPPMFQCLMNEAPFIWKALSNVWELNKSRKKLSGIGKVKAKSPKHRTRYGRKIRLQGLQQSQSPRLQLKDRVEPCI